MQKYVSTASPFLIYRQGIFTLDISQIFLHSHDQWLICNTHTHTQIWEQTFKVLVFVALFLYYWSRQFYFYLCDSRKFVQKREMLCERCYGGKSFAVLPRASAAQQFERLRSKSRVISAQLHRLPKGQMLLEEALWMFSVLASGSSYEQPCLMSACDFRFDWFN